MAKKPNPFAAKAKGAKKAVPPMAPAAPPAMGGAAGPAPFGFSKGGKVGKRRGK
jgi:hypothetical protein